MIKEINHYLKSNLLDENEKLSMYKSIWFNIKNERLPFFEWTLLFFILIRVEIVFIQYKLWKWLIS